MEFGKGLEKWDSPALPETPLPPVQHQVTLLEAATLLGCVVYGMGYPKPREGLQSDLWGYLRPEGTLGKWQTWRMKKTPTGQMLTQMPYMALRPRVGRAVIPGLV